MSVRPGYAHRRELERDLGHHYEACKKDNAGRFKGRRLKSYCAAVSWTRAKKSGRYDDYFDAPSHGKVTPMRRTPPRDPRTGKFLTRRSRRRPKSGSEARRTRSRPRRTRARATRAMTYETRTRRAPAPPRRRRRARAAGRATRRRRSSGRRGQTNIAIVPVGGTAMRETRRRRSGRRRHSAKAPPLLTAGGLVVFSIGGLIGYEIVDLGDRMIASDSTTASPAPTLPAGVSSVAQFNDNALAAKPTLGRIFWGLGNIALGFIVGRLVPWSGLKLFFYGWGAAATFHLGGQLINTWIVQPLVKGGSMARLFTHEENAQTLLNPAAAGTTQGPPQLQSRNGTPVASAAPARLPAAQPTSRVPVALATSRTATAAAPAGNGTLGQQHVHVIPLTLPGLRGQATFHYVPEGSAVPPSPPASPPPAPPTGTPPSPGGGSLPGGAPGGGVPMPPSGGSPTPMPNGGSPPMGGNGCGPCAPTSAPNIPQSVTTTAPQQIWSGTPCCGMTPCGCGRCGQPPADGPRHPLFRSMMLSQRRAA